MTPSRGSSHDFKAHFSPETYFEHEADIGACQGLLNMIAMAPEQFSMRVQNDTQRVPPETLMRLALCGMLLYFWLLHAAWISIGKSSSETHPHPWFRGFVLLQKISALASGVRHDPSGWQGMDDEQRAAYDRIGARIETPLNKSRGAFLDDFARLARFGWLTDLGVLTDATSQQEFERYSDQWRRYQQTGITGLVNEFAFTGARV